MTNKLGFSVLVSALVTFGGCQKKDEPKTAAQEKGRPVVASTAPARPAFTPQSVKPSDSSNVVSLSELKKGDVIRGDAPDTLGSLTEVQTINNSPETAENTEQTAKAPVLSYSEVMGCENGSCKVGDLQTTKNQSEALKGMLRHIPLLNHTTAMADEKETIEEQKLMAGDAGNFNEIKLPASAYSGKLADEKKAAAPAALDKPQPISTKDLWPGGIPAIADIDPALGTF